MDLGMATARVPNSISPDQDYDEDNYQSPQVLTDVPLEPPPSYAIARAPDHPVTYSFSTLSISNSSMLLVPPLNAPSQTPLYHISVGHYPFLPTCLITSVTKGSDEHGPYVGGFKTMMFGQESTRFGSQTVTICGREHRLWQIFTKQPKRQGVQTFRWKPFGSSSRVLMWTCNKWPQPGTFTCYSDSDGENSHTKYAEFTTVTELLRPSASPEQPTLTMMPSGHRRFDDILISALLLERQRLLAVLNSES